PLLTHASLEPIMRRRRLAPLFIIDIAVPRAAEASVTQLENVYLYNVDDLQGIVESANAELQKEMAKTHRILDEEFEKFRAWHESRQIVPTLKELTEKMERFKAVEVRKILSKFPNLPDRERAAVEAMAH